MHMLVDARSNCTIENATLPRNGGAVHIRFLFRVRGTGASVRAQSTASIRIHPPSAADFLICILMRIDAHEIRVLLCCLVLCFCFRFFSAGRGAVSD